MSDLLREALHDLGEEGRLRLSPGELARTGWVAGRRRRLRARLATLGVCAAVLALLVLAVPVVRSVRVQPTAPVRPAGVSAYPAFIGSGRPTAPLPARPGPLAGVLEDASYGDVVTYSAVTSTGLRWRIPSSDAFAPVLSHDGQLLLTVTGRPRRLVVHDLVGGTTRPVPTTGSSTSTPDEWVYWPPDNDSQVLSGRARRLLDLRTGRVTRLPTTGITAGLATGNRAVTVSYRSPRDDDMTDVRAHVVALATGTGPRHRPAAAATVDREPDLGWGGDRVAGRLDPRGGQ